MVTIIRYNHHDFCHANSGKVVPSQKFVLVRRCHVGSNETMLRSFPTSSQQFWGQADHESSNFSPAAEEYGDSLLHSIGPPSFA